MDNKDILTRTRILTVDVFIRLLLERFNLPRSFYVQVNGLN